ncbi:hypothetical protein GCM10010247_22700 [Streptomyces calvus]|nr:hypothetical protein GCM10010247_22700 [Streptomyces calvus]
MAESANSGALTSSDSASPKETEKRPSGRKPVTVKEGSTWILWAVWVRKGGGGEGRPSDRRAVGRLEVPAGSPRADGERGDVAAEACHRCGDAIGWDCCVRLTGRAGAR